MRKVVSTLVAVAVLCTAPNAVANPLVGSSQAFSQSSSQAGEELRTAIYRALPPQARNHPLAQQLAPAPAPSAPAPAQDQPADCSNCVAVTFDDGPAASTNQVLDILARKHATASFFVLAPKVRANAGVVKRMRAAGHTVASHTATHRDLTKLSQPEVRREVEESSRAIADATGASPRFVRPPYGALNATVSDAARVQGQAVVLWDVDTLDWKHRDPARMCKTAVDQARAGSIILMHDIHPTTAQAVECVIDGLRAKGLRPASLDQMVPQPVPGKTYTTKNS
ncbi:polysaccharide deacetylase family protein [Corynebacterium sp. UMB10321]|uniref:polysaccharide deacetylase family protein n=1 Tax=Corynebacterium sp. UMB10321 TaxID=3046312 RepID=UPI00254FDC4E|nr:polysaccharide deacetylase family protein [Corynebacterium sp. UMB10321]MDK8243574.1 polysaccharide deacetylase family protein [Corynebacterium sp. UMB10321]